MSRVFVIGDVHGCAVEFAQLIGELGITPEDRLVLLGDLMDRGPDPVACVHLARALGAECTASNHDEKHVRFRRHERARALTGKKNPIRFTDLQAEQNAALSDDDIAWIAGLPMSIDLGARWYAIHAGLEPCKTFAEQKDCESLLRTRFINEDGTAFADKNRDAPDPTDKWFWATRWRGPEKIVYGHHIHGWHPKIGGLVQGRTVGIDTGCYAGGRLTAMAILHDGTFRFHAVTAKRIYCPLSEKYGPNRPLPLATEGA